MGFEVLVFTPSLEAACMARCNGLDAGSKAPEPFHPNPTKERKLSKVAAC